MGSQQLLIIVLIAFVVGIGIWVGIRLVDSFNQSSERDLVMHQISVVVGEAKRYSSTPKSIGGGEGSYEGFSPLPKLLDTGRIRINMTVSTTWILFQAFGTTKGYDEENPVEVVAQFDMGLDNYSTLSFVN